jgi:hypothetical protein
LRRIVQLIAPDRDVRWLKEVEADLELLKSPKSKYPRLVSTAALVEAGLSLIRRGSSRR